MIKVIIAIAVLVVCIGTPIVLKICRAKRAKRKIIHVDDRRCARCGQCLKNCPNQVLVMVKDKKDLRVVVSSPEQCKGCGKCLKICRFNALKLVNRETSQCHEETN